ncbi:hypothetical protein ACCT30_27070, partial [Rhizobium ruizarguesonis]
MNSKYLPLLATIVIFVLAYGGCALQYPNMLSTRVIGNLLTDNAFLGIAAVGMTFVIISGGIDLSIGSSTSNNIRDRSGCCRSRARRPCRAP